MNMALDIDLCLVLSFTKLYTFGHFSQVMSVAKKRPFCKFFICKKYLHLWTFKTPTFAKLRAVMSDKDSAQLKADWALLCATLITCEKCPMV